MKYPQKIDPDMKQFYHHTTTVNVSVFCERMVIWFHDFTSSYSGEDVKEKQLHLLQNHRKTVTFLRYASN